MNIALRVVQDSRTKENESDSKGKYGKGSWKENFFVFSNLFKLLSCIADLSLAKQPRNQAIMMLVVVGVMGCLQLLIKPFAWPRHNFQEIINIGLKLSQLACALAGFNGDLSRRDTEVALFIITFAAMIINAVFTIYDFYRSKYFKVVERVVKRISERGSSLDRAPPSSVGAQKPTSN